MPPPLSKGKVERIHQVWQQRLMPCFKLNGITPDSDLGLVNEHLVALCDHRNHHEVHREIGLVGEQPGAQQVRVRWVRRLSAFENYTTIGFLDLTNRSGKE